MKNTWQVFVIAMALAFSAVAKTNPPGTFTFKGTVVDASGAALAGAAIEVSTSPQGTPFGGADPTGVERIVAGINGDFEISLPRTGAFLVARKPGFAPTWRQLWNAQGDTEQRLVLTPPAVLAGTVVDETDKPVAGAEVFAFMAFSETPLEGGQTSHNYLYGKPARDLFSARTTADGRFRITGFPTNASANLTVKAAGKTLQASGQPTSWGLDSMQCQAGQEDLRLIVEPAGSVEGRIVPEDGSSTAPIARLSLQSDRPGLSGMAAALELVESQPDGTFRVPDLAAGDYRLLATFGTNALPDWVTEAVPVSVEAGQTTRDVQLKAVRGGVLQITVFGKSDRQPRAQVAISAYREHNHAAASSDDHGVAWLRLPPGEYQVNASIPGRQENATATVEVGKTNRLEIELPDPLNVKGVVRGPDGRPAAGVEVRIVGSHMPGGGMLKTDADGRFEMEWNPRQFGGSDTTYCLLARDLGRNLAVAQDLEEDSGPLDLRLEPALTIAGRAEYNGQPVTNTTATLVFWTGRSGMHLQGVCISNNTPGHFEIPALPPGRRYGVYVSAPGYGQSGHLNVAEPEGDSRRIEIEPVQLKPANIQLAGQVVDADDKPVAGAQVHLSGDGQPNANAHTDREGRFRFERVCEGSARLWANARSAHGSISAEGGDTNVVLKLGESYSASPGATQRKLKGTVTDPEGKPVPGVPVSVYPFNESKRKTDANGNFNLSFTLQSWQMESGGDPCLVVQDLARDLAAAESLPEETTNVTVQLKPAVTVVGHVEGPDGVALTNAQIGVWLKACNSYNQLSEQLASTDARGNFEIRTVPAGPKYIVFAKAKDHGRQQHELEIESATNRVELPAFVLKFADQTIAGRVVNTDDKPVSGVHVSLSGEGQPDGSVTTDGKGCFKFKVCEGSIRLFASGQNGYANATVEPGDTNIVLQLSRNDSAVREAPKRVSLKAKPLPNLESVGLAAGTVPSGKSLLLCLLDAEQRPSRRAARVLAERAEALRQKGVKVALIQATATTSTETFQEWTNSSALPFPVGRVEKKTPEARWATDVVSLPWLILTDAEGKVSAEGFALDELDAKVDALKR